MRPGGGRSQHCWPGGRRPSAGSLAMPPAQTTIQGYRRAAETPGGRTSSTLAFRWGARALADIRSVLMSVRLPRRFMPGGAVALDSIYTILGGGGGLVLSSNRELSSVMLISGAAVHVCSPKYTLLSPSVHPRVNPDPLNSNDSAAELGPREGPGEHAERRRKPHPLAICLDIRTSSRALRRYKWI